MAVWASLFQPDLGHVALAAYSVCFPPVSPLPARAGAANATLPCDAWPSCLLSVGPASPGAQRRCWGGQEGCCSR